MNEIAKQQKLIIRDVEEITASNWHAKKAAELEATREQARKSMQYQAHKAAKEHSKRRAFSNICFVVLGASTTMMGLLLGAGALGAASVFALVDIAAIGGAMGCVQ